MNCWDMEMYSGWAVGGFLMYQMTMYVRLTRIMIYTYTKISKDVRLALGTIFGCVWHWSVIHLRFLQIDQIGFRLSLCIKFLYFPYPVIARLLSFHFAVFFVDWLYSIPLFCAILFSDNFDNCTEHYPVPFPSLSCPSWIHG